MTAPNCLYLIAMVLAVVGCGTLVYAEGDVTVISTSAAPTPTPVPTSVAPDGTPVVHKSLHKKKQDAISPASGADVPSGPTTAAASAPTTTDNKTAKKTSPPDIITAAHPVPAVGAAVFHSQSAAPAPNTTTAHPSSLAATTAATTTTTSAAKTASVSVGPTVETGLPVARYPGVGTPIQGVSTYIPTTATLPSGKTASGTTSHQSYFASTLPSSAASLTSAAAGSFSTPSRTTSSSSSSDFDFNNYGKKPTHTYNWKTNIITTEFWIGEGGSSVSSTNNIASSWDEDWLPNNHGSDSPYNRNGYAAGNHASTLNPFYVALPFNDLAFPDKAREWLPRGWYRPPKDGKQVSACKDRWVEIKNAQGRTCYAQWEDVGPLRYDHAEYVFGNERPIGMGDDHAGLDVSPAVAQYLGIDGKNRITSWRFVDDEDVLPGQWLKLDEQAVIFTALHQLKNTSLPIQRATEPVNDPSSVDSNKKKVDASKG